MICKFRAIDSSWCTHESPGWKSDWLQVRSLLFSKDLKRESKTIFTKNFAANGQECHRSAIFLSFVCHLFFELWYLLFFHSFGKHSFITLLLKRIYRGLEIGIAHNFNMAIDIPSQLWALFGTIEQISLTNVTVSMLKSECLVTVSKKVIGQVCFDYKISYKFIIC